MEAVVVVKLVQGKLESVKIDIPHELLVLDYAEGPEGEPRVLEYRRKGGVLVSDVEEIERALELYKPNG